MQAQPMLLALVTLLTSGVSGLYEDQVGKIDWYRSNIGKVKLALFHSLGQQKLAYVVAEARQTSVLACLNLRNGQTVWRQVLPDGESLDLLQLHGKTLVTAGPISQGLMVRSWSVFDGSMQWDTFLEGRPSGVPTDIVLLNNKLVVSWLDTVTMLMHGTGEPLWKWQYKASAQEHVTIHKLVLLDTEIQLVGLQHSTAAQEQTVVYTAQLNPADGTMVRSKTVDPEPVVPAGDMVVTGDQQSVAMLDTTGKSLLLLSLGSFSLSETKLTTLSNTQPPVGMAAPQVVPVSMPNALAVKLSPEHMLLLQIGAGKVQVFKEVTGKAHALAANTNKESNLVVALATSDAQEMQVELMEFQGTQPGNVWVAEGAAPVAKSAHGAVETAFLNVYARKDGTNGQRLLVVTQDHALQLLQGGKVVWCNEEALASVTHVEFIPLPPPLVGGEGEEDELKPPPLMFAMPLALELFKQRLDGFKDLFVAPTEDLSAPPILTRDNFGFRQVIVVLTAASKAYALLSQGGRVLWSHFWEPLSGCAVPPQLMVLTTSKTELMVTEQLVVLAQPPPGAKGGLPLLTHLEGLTGEVATTFNLPRRVLHMSKTALQDSHGSPIIMVVDASMQVSLHPDSDEVNQLFTTAAAKVFFSLVDQSKKKITGYRITKAPRGGFQAMEQWVLMLPPDAEQITITHHDTTDRVHSPVRVLGDRNLLHKYINPHLLAVGLVTKAAGAASAVATSTGGVSAESSVHLYLVDSVSGRVVYDTVHGQCNGPVTLLLGDHWVAYHYWSIHRQRFQITISELYVNRTDTAIAALLMRGPDDITKRENQFSSFSVVKPHVLSQSYIFPTALASMALTKTMGGVTPKQLLMGLKSGQLLSMDKRFIDPRRPMAQLTMTDREEGLVQYAASLGNINPMNVLSHTHKIGKLSKVYTAPSALESTSLVLVTGLDLFGSITAAAGAFDKLNDDFNYIALVFAIVGLTILTIGSSMVSRSRDIQKIWR